MGGSFGTRGNPSTPPLKKSETGVSGEMRTGPTERPFVTDGPHHSRPLPSPSSYPGVGPPTDSMSGTPCRPWKVPSGRIRTPTVLVSRRPP